MASRNQFEIDEWYHCYNRGVDKRKIFQTSRDYERFLMLMYTGNGSNPLHISNLKDPRLRPILSDNSIDRGTPLVDIGAYCLMPNHFHLILKETSENGITSFMQKIFTGYAMYFNKKNERTGTLLSGPFKSKHIGDDNYLKQVVSYVHLNPIELFEPGWKERHGNTAMLERKLLEYPYSSLPDFIKQKAGKVQLERKILGNEIFDLFDTIPSVHEIVSEASEYYQEIATVFDGKARP